ncbi:MAG: cobalt ECF transporter T component CbiQ [Gammaproteobacteria bacterium]|nr:cobalt ECF transporter T component CbiQ [Gammaproteobacteria bacterium]
MALDIDRYSSIDSSISRWDPRFKVFSLGVLIISIALLKTIPMAFVALIIAAIVIGMSALPLHFISNGLSFILVFLVPFFFIMPFSYPGEAAFHVLGLPFAWEGLRYATLIFTKALAIVLISFSIFGSSRFDVSMIALQKLKCPKIFVQMLLFTYRYTHVFLEEMHRMHTSMHSRGFVAGANAQTLRIYGNFIGTLLVRSFERTDRVYKAMLSKGYQGELHSMVKFHSSFPDVLKGLIVVGLSLVLLLSDYGGIFKVAERGWY